MLDNSAIQTNNVQTNLFQNVLKQVLKKLQIPSYIIYLVKLITGYINAIKIVLKPHYYVCEHFFIFILVHKKGTTQSDQYICHSPREIILRYLNLFLNETKLFIGPK